MEAQSTAGGKRLSLSSKLRLKMINDKNKVTTSTVSTTSALSFEGETLTLNQNNTSILNILKKRQTEEDYSNCACSETSDTCVSDEVLPEFPENSVLDTDSNSHFLCAVQTGPCVEGVSIAEPSLTENQKRKPSSITESSEHPESSVGEEHVSEDGKQSSEESSDGSPKTKRNKEDMRLNFEVNLTQEAKDLLKEFVAATASGKPPTLSKVKWLTKESLEQIIRFNDRPIYQLGNHEQLAAVVLDYIKNGVPPRCPKCKRGSLRFSNGRKRNGKRYYWCPGFSPNGYHFFGCNFKAQREEISRQPFKCPE